MFSIEVYEKVREEVFHLLTVGNSLLEEDLMMLRLFANSENTRNVLDSARMFKEEGNVLFKRGMIDDALEKYGYAGLVITYRVLGEEFLNEFFDLVTSILLNSAACFSKKREFELVGLVCSLVLEFNPNQVKALFRRALAAIELGECDLALWDLLLASELEPSNKEVRAKLDQLRYSMTQKCQDDGSRDDVVCDPPLGLGIVLASPKKKKVKECFNQPCEEDVKDNKIMSLDDCSVVKAALTKVDEESKDVKEELTVDANESEGRTSTSECERSKNAHEDEIMDDCVSAAGPKQDIGTELMFCMGEGDHQEGLHDTHDVVVEDVSTVKKTNLAESEVRFVNRHKADSFISFRGEMYQKLRVGKPLQFVNSRTGSFMTIKLLPKPTACSHESSKVDDKDKADATKPYSSVQGQLKLMQMEEETNTIPHENLTTVNSECKLMEVIEDNTRPAIIVDEKECVSFGSSLPIRCNLQSLPNTVRRPQRISRRKKFVSHQTIYGAKRCETLKRSQRADFTNLCTRMCHPAGRKRRLVVSLSEVCTGQRRKFLRSSHGSIGSNGVCCENFSSRLQSSIEDRFVKYDACLSLGQNLLAIHGTALAVNNGG